MPEFMTTLFNSDGFMPHGHCYLWTPSLLWTFVVADTIIVMSYFSIPFGLLYFVRKRKDLRFNWIFMLFSAFIFACGVTHLLSIWTIWHPDYWIDAMAKAVTAMISLVTMVLMWSLIPRLLKIPSAEQLETVVASLENEIEHRKIAEAELFRLKSASDDRFRAIFESAAVGVAELESSTGRYLRVNHKYCDIVGYRLEEIMREDLPLLTHPDDLQAERNNMQALMDGRIREFSMEKRCFRKDGSTAWVSLTVSPMWQADETPGTHIAIVQDIAERKLAEEAIKQQLDELRRWHQATLGQEGRIMELKREVNELLERAGEPRRYASVAMEAP